MALRVVYFILVDEDEVIDSSQQSIAEISESFGLKSLLMCCFERDMKREYEVGDMKWEV